MREKNILKRKPPHGSTYKTQNKFNQKKHLPFNKERRELSNALLFFPEGSDFAKLSPSQKLVFLLAISAVMSTAVTKLQAQEKLHTDTQKALIPLKQNAFFSQEHLNATNVTSLNTNHHMIATQSLPNQSLRQTEMSSMLEIHNMTAQVRDCQEKLNGVSAGKICLIKDKKYLLKVCGNEIKKRDRYSNILLGMHNLYFIKENIGINIPNLKLIYERNGTYISSDGEVINAEHYLASEFVANFTNFKDISHSSKRTMLKLNFFKKINMNDMEIKEAIRKKVIEQIGEVGVAKLAVAGTFIQDLVMNDGNWGVANNELVIIDADHSPQSLEEYLVEAAKMPDNINIDFSIQILEHMKSTYTQMLHTMPISFHPKVDFTLENYQFLINQYLIACDQALNKIKTTYPDLPCDKPSKEVNQALSNALRTQLLEFIKIEPESSSVSAHY